MMGSNRRVRGFTILTALGASLVGLASCGSDDSAVGVRPEGCVEGCEHAGPDGSSSVDAEGGAADGRADDPIEAGGSADGSDAGDGGADDPIEAGGNADGSDAGDSGSDGPGDSLVIDPTFNLGQIATTPIRDGGDQVLTVLPLPDGKVVAAGFDITSRAVFLARFQTDGTLDTTFGSGGKVLVAGGDLLDSFGGVTRAADGKLLVGDGRGVFGGAVTRLGADGAIDPSFGDRGRVLLPSPPSGIAVSADGKIYAAGAGPNSSLLRLTSTGAVDATFGNAGTVAVTVASHDVLVDPAGNVLLVGADSSGIVLRRLTSAGASDTTFNGTGSLSTGLGAPSLPNAFFFHTVEVRSDGTIVVGGRSAGGKGVIAQYSAAGAPDTSFAGGGIATIGTTTTAPESTTIGPDGRVVAVASGKVYRFTAAGDPDSAFASGQMTPGFIVHTAVQTTAGTVFAAGATPVAGSIQNGAIQRITEAGAADPAFGAGGTATVNLGASRDQIRSVAVQVDGKIVAAGVAATETNFEGWAVARYASDGSLDPTFGAAGKVVTTGTYQLSPRASGVAVDTAGNIVVGGSTVSRTEFVAARFTSAGVLDTNYGNSGQTHFLFNGNGGICNTAVLDASDRLLLGGVIYSGPGPALDFALARLTAQGNLDTTFNGTGQLTTVVGSTSVERSSLTALAIQTDGKIVAAGSAFGTGSYVMAVARYTDGGALDTTFGTGGTVLVDAISSNDFRMQSAHGVTIQPDGKIVVVGTAGYAAGTLIPEEEDIWRLRAPNPLIVTKLVVLRFLPNGTLDPSFGQSGKLTTTLGARTVVGQAVKVRPDGRIWVAGELWDGMTPKRGFLVRLTASGALDTTFEAPTGLGLLEWGIGGPSSVRALAWQSDGKLVAGGDVFVSPTGSDFALFRLSSQ